MGPRVTTVKVKLVGAEEVPSCGGDVDEGRSWVLPGGARLWGGDATQIPVWRREGLEYVWRLRDVASVNLGYNIFFRCSLASTVFVEGENIYLDIVYWRAHHPMQTVSCVSSVWEGRSRLGILLHLYISAKRESLAAQGSAEPGGHALNVNGCLPRTFFLTISFVLCYFIFLTCILTSNPGRGISAGSGVRIVIKTVIHVALLHIILYCASYVIVMYFMVMKCRYNTLLWHHLFVITDI